MVIESLERIAFALVAITSLALQEVAGPELTFLGWRVLVILGEGDAPIRVGDLGMRLGLSRPSVSKLARRLERRALVTLSADPSDRRAILAALAPAGEDLRRAVIARRREVLANVLQVPLPGRTDAAFEAVAKRLEPFI